MDSSIFNEAEVLHQLAHFLPAQAPLKDFVHHNTLHAFQELDFFTALRKSATIFGNRTTLSLKVFKEKYQQQEITDQAITESIKSLKGNQQLEHWKKLMFNCDEPTFFTPKIGRLREHWQSDYAIDMDGMVRPNIIRLVNSYLDQGIAFEGFPKSNKGLLAAVLYVQNNSYTKLFSSKKAIKLLSKKDKSLKELLRLIVGDEAYYAQYLLDQQYAHPGLSGLVCAIEAKPDAVYDSRPVTLFDLIYLELLFELEALENFVNKNFKPLAIGVDFLSENIFNDVPNNDYWKVLELWQEAFEMMYHDQVLAGILTNKETEKQIPQTQAFFCIDDREESIRRNIEVIYPECETFGTPGHFSLPIKFKPEGAKFSTQSCPGVIEPQHLIKEKDRKTTHKKDIHFHNHSHKFLAGFVISQTVGFWSTIKLFSNIFKPKESVAQYNATKDHMDYQSTLIYENKNGEKEDGLQVGFTLEEMITIVKSELSNTGLTENFAPLVYFFGHGGSSTNNPYFAGYNCGACSGRPGTVNAKTFALIANRKEVREGLAKKGLTIPQATYFIGAYHDTTQDTFDYFDEDILPAAQQKLHTENKIKFAKALSTNAKERARQFLLINIKKEAKKVHKAIKERSQSLFEPRPEYNHSNNSLFIVGNRKITKNLFLDQRAFLNSYNYKADKDGQLLSNILNAGTGVCGGINLEYFFSTVDNQKLGAGSKLPQNVLGLYGVANGVKGDLRPGLPWQMIDVHDPIRILTVIENTPEMVLEVLKANPDTFNWYAKEWMKLAVFNPHTKAISILKNEKFVPYVPFNNNIKKAGNLEQLIESTHKNLPVYQLN